MTKKHWIQVIVCFLVILIGSVLGIYYYQEYISPESFTIGSITNGTYKELAIKDYLSDDTVLFSQNINDVSFSINEGTATYDYNFDPKEFNGLEKSYLIYVNNYIINDITTNAGTISGTYKINFQDVDNETLCSSDISISFAFRSLSSTLRVSLPASDVGYLLNYFNSDNFIITLAECPFDFGSKDGELDEKVEQIIDLTNQIADLNNDILELQGEIADKVQEIADLNEDLTNKDEIIAGLQSDIEELQAQVQQLQGSLAEKTQQLEDLQAEYDQLEDDYGELNDEYVALGNLYEQALATIESLEAQVLELEQQVTYYEKLLEAYQNSEKLIVTFTVDDFAYEVKLVDENEYVTKPETDPTKEGYSFEFWSLDGVTEFNFSTTPITDDTTIVAVFEKLISVIFQNGDTQLSNNYYEANSAITLPEDPERVNCDFIGWTLDDGETIVDFENFQLTEDVVFKAVFGYWSSMIFNSYSDFVTDFISNFSNPSCYMSAEYNEDPADNSLYFDLNDLLRDSFSSLKTHEFKLEIFSICHSGAGVIGSSSVVISEFDTSYNLEDSSSTIILNSDGILRLNLNESSPILIPRKNCFAIGSITTYTYQL